MEAGFGGIVASAQEARTLRALIGMDKFLVTPGIRALSPLSSLTPHTRAGDDQKRVMTPAAAIEAGASHLVVARPIIQAQEPLLAVRAILADMIRTQS